MGEGRGSVVVVQGSLRWRAEVEREGWRIRRAEDLQQIDRLLHRECPQCVILSADSTNPVTCLKWTAAVRAHRDNIPVILLVAQGTEELAVAALRAGANDYVREAGGAEELLRAMRRFRRRNAAGQEPPAAKALVGSSEAMERVRRRVERVAKSPATVLITGETGSGKEVAAEIIHASSARRGNPWVCINCAAIPDSLWEGELHGRERGAYTGADTSYEGKLRQAEGGTLFLDEIGEVSLAMQAKLLRFLESREVQSLGSRKTDYIDVRVIAATNRDLEQDLLEGRFRADLYYRLNVVRLKLPPLREHKEDIPQIARHLLPEINRRLGTGAQAVADEALRHLMAYDWPGNVRELRNFLEFAAMESAGPVLEKRHFPECDGETWSGGRQEANERDLLLSALVESNWNKTAAAQKLNWSRMTVYRKIAQYGLGVPVSQHMSHSA